VHKITENVAKQGMQFQSSVLEGLQEAAEAYLVDPFEVKDFDCYNDYY
jgi:hypothetical protein